MHKMTEKEDSNQAIQKVINEIWQQFDDDNSGSLDYEEAEKFILSIIGTLKCNKHFKPSKEVMHAIFADLDTDSSGSIEK